MSQDVTTFALIKYLFDFVGSEYRGVDLKFQQSTQTIKFQQTNRFKNINISDA